MLWDRKSIHTIHCFGDSLTAGYGALPGEGWVEVLAKRHPKMGWYNDGQCGALTEDILDALECAAALARPGEGFFFMGGTNDILCGFRLSSIEGRVQERLSLISEKVPLAIGIPPLSTKESIWTGWQSEAVYERNQADLAAYGDFLKSSQRTSARSPSIFRKPSRWRMAGTMTASIRMGRGMSASRSWRRKYG